mgnify:CR=1 FL=1
MSQTNESYCRLTAKQVVDLYFIENRSRILDIASFLDRVDRYPGADEAKADYRYQAFVEALRIVLDASSGRTKAVQVSLSDPTTEPLASAVGLKAWGAWQGEER